MDQKFTGKIVVVTGGTSGIGFASAQNFIESGATVIITGRDEDKLTAACEKLGKNSFGIRADVSKMKELTDMYDIIQKRYGRIDVLFANAGVAQFVPFADVSEEHYDYIMIVDVKGLFFAVQ